MASSRQKAGKRKASRNRRSEKKVKRDGSASSGRGRQGGPAAKKKSGGKPAAAKKKSSKKSGGHSGRKRSRRSSEVELPRADGKVRLQRFLAATGLDSRRKCEEYILTGRVRVDDKEVLDVGMVIDPTKQKVRVDGELIRPEPKRYFLLNKPKGYLCTNNDPRGRRRAVDLVPAKNLRLFTVGRLDENSEGLLLVTNDGEMSNMLAHPRYQVPRSYRVQVAGVPTPAKLRELKQGIHFSDGFFRVKGVKRLKTQGRSAFLEIELTEGRNREIRRLFARVGHKVINLTRVSFGPLKLGRLASGKTRPLRPIEMKALREFVASGILAVNRSKKNSDSRRGPRAGTSLTKATGKKSAAKKSVGKKTTERKPSKGKGVPVDDGNKGKGNSSQGTRGKAKLNKKKIRKTTNSPKKTKAKTKTNSKPAAKKTSRRIIIAD